LVFIAVTPLARHRAWHRDRCRCAAATASPCRAVALVPERDLLFCAKHLFVAASGWQNRAKHCQAGRRPLLDVGLALDPRRSWGPWPSADRATVRDARSSFASGGPFLVDSAPGLLGLFVPLAPPFPFLFFSRSSF